MKAIFISLAILLSTTTVDARNITIPFANVTCITSLEPVGKYSIEFTHPKTKQKTTASVSMTDYQKLMKATFDHNYTARCVFTGKAIKVTLIKKTNSK